MFPILYHLTKMSVRHHLSTEGNGCYQIYLKIVCSKCNKCECPDFTVSADLPERAKSNFEIHLIDFRMLDLKSRVLVLFLQIYLLFYSLEKR